MDGDVGTRRWAAAAGGAGRRPDADGATGRGTAAGAGTGREEVSEPGHGVRDEIPELAGAILDVVDLVPAGRVVTYGDVAEYLGRGGPRTVGSAMARWGGAVAWWRVVSADGSPVAAYREEALRHLRAEGTALRPDGRRVDLTLARWDGEPVPGTP